MIALALLTGLTGVAAGLYIAAPLLAERRRALAGIAAAGAIALGAFGLYAVGAAPHVPDQPYGAVVERLAAADPATLSLEEQEERLRARVRAEPEDGEALALLGRLLARTGRELEAVAVLERALRVEEDPRVLSDLGQALVNLNEGEVTAPAERAFARAHELDPALPEPAFFLGAASYQRGEREAAARLWAGILTRLPPADPFRQAIAARAADLLSRPAAGPLDAGAQAPFAGEAGEDPEALIAAMVAGLETRLQDDPGDFSGWLTLIRARASLGEMDAARAAFEEAARRFGGEGREIILAALARALGIEPPAAPEQESR